MHGTICLCMVGLPPSGMRRITKQGAVSDVVQTNQGAIRRSKLARAQESSADRRTASTLYEPVKCELGRTMSSLN